MSDGDASQDASTEPPPTLHSPPGLPRGFNPAPSVSRALSDRKRRRPPVRARLALHQDFQLPLAQVEVVVRANDPDTQMAQRELASPLQIVGVVEPHAVAAVDEGDAPRADDLADVTADDQRSVLVDPEPEQLGVAGDDDEQPLQ